MNANGWSSRFFFDPIIQMRGKLLTLLDATVWIVNKGCGVARLSAISIGTCAKQTVLSKRTYNTMPIYYHVSMVTHLPGFVIPHGRFGSLFSNRPATVEDGFVMTWEAVLETARRLVAPTAPSRLNCLFACETLSAAKTFQSNYRKDGTILKVEVGIEVPTFAGNFDLISYKQGGTFIERWARNAIRYWG
jgi:hypothetical protein